MADYRFAVRPRTYPRRDLTTTDVLTELRQGGVEDRLLKYAETLLSARGPDFLLSRFQAESASAVFQGLRASTSSGTIVGAGWPGKTLAFYLPALSMVATSRPGTRVLAVYPRIELLRDQLASTFAEARRLDGESRRIRLGTLYGATPRTRSGCAIPGSLFRADVCVRTCAARTAVTGISSGEMTTARQRSRYSDASAARA